MKLPTIAILVGILGFFVLSLAVVGVSVISTYNGLSGLKNTYEMKVKSNQAEFDNMWKKIQEVAEIPEQKKESLKEVLAAYTSGRQAGQQQLMTWVKEAVPATTGLDIYDKLMNTVTGSRDTWTMKQTELVGIAEQYNARIVKFPDNYIAGMFGFAKIEPQVITSTRTESTFQAGKDDQVGLFKK
jgi:hypothetical protein